MSVLLIAPKKQPLPYGRVGDFLGILSLLPTTSPSKTLRIQISNTKVWDNEKSIIYGWLQNWRHTLFILTCGLKNLKKAPERRTIQICSDSQAVFLAIESSKVKSRLVLECKKTLNDLASIRQNGAEDWLEKGSDVPHWARTHTSGTLLNRRIAWSMKELLTKEFENSWL
ncbi:hypothetical protein NQ317_001578 [Molorchus minor]|uniref:RNase H type-1 domain-containing protein n=1 Tax=Molorchus minor TaxID=1323400 RepID=A0ABQ9J5V5_9CUCU|nr:hypothetical protein NQ317_001578 [Molorchus minor]